MTHTDHNGVELKPEEVDSYWKGFILGKNSLKKKIMSFSDETGFERYLINNGWVLIDCNYSTNYFTTYRTIARLYEKLGKNISIGLVHTDNGSRVGIYNSSRMESLVKELDSGHYMQKTFDSLPTDGQYEQALRYHTGKSGTILRGEMINDI